MIGNGYWSTGISVYRAYAGMDEDGWGASLEYLDGGFCNDEPDKGIVSTEGMLHTRYTVRDSKAADVLTVVIDVLKADAERLGIEWKTPCIYYRGDGEDPDYPPPDGWRELLDAHAARLGWRSIYMSAPAS